MLLIFSIDNLTKALDNRTMLKTNFLFFNLFIFCLLKIKIKGQKTQGRFINIFSFLTTYFKALKNSKLKRPALKNRSLQLKQFYKAFSFFKINFFFLRFIFSHKRGFKAPLLNLKKFKFFRIIKIGVF